MTVRGVRHRPARRTVTSRHPLLRNRGPQGIAVLPPETGNGPSPATDMGMHRPAVSPRNVSTVLVLAVLTVARTASAQSPRLVMDVHPGPQGSFTAHATAVGSDDRLFFGADDGAHGDEAWVTDGTTAGTHLISDLVPGTTGARFYVAAPMNGTMLFGGPPYSTDGTTMTRLTMNEVNEGFGAPAVGGNQAWFFSGVGNAASTRLWRSNGSAGGTTMVKEFAQSGSLTPSSGFGFIGTTAYFGERTTAEGTELWKSDGTAAGTVLVADAVSGTGSLDPRSLFSFGNMVLFTGTDPQHGRELWKSDGTAAGTVLLSDIKAGPASTFGANTYFTAALGRVFFVANDGSSGSELWVTDGTPAGTKIVKDLTPGAANTVMLLGDVYAGALWFSAFDGVVPGLYRTDGTEAGTTKVTALPGPQLAASLVAASTASSTSRPSRPSGDPTVPLRGQRRSRGLRGSRRFNLPSTPEPASLLFATDATHGTEPWVLDAAPEPDAGPPRPARTRAARAPRIEPRSTTREAPARRRAPRVEKTRRPRKPPSPTGARQSPPLDVGSALRRAAQARSAGPAPSFSLRPQSSGGAPRSRRAGLPLRGTTTTEPSLRASQSWRRSDGLASIVRMRVRSRLMFVATAALAACNAIVGFDDLKRVAAPSDAGPYVRQHDIARRRGRRRRHSAWLSCRGHGHVRSRVAARVRAVLGRSRVLLGRQHERQARRRSRHDAERLLAGPRPRAEPGRRDRDQRRRHPYLRDLERAERSSAGEPTTEGSSATQARRPSPNSSRLPSRGCQPAARRLTSPPGFTRPALSSKRAISTAGASTSAPAATVVRAFRRRPSTHRSSTSVSWSAPAGAAD